MNEYSTYVGIDLGDKKSHVCVTDAVGTVVREFAVKTERSALAEALVPWPCSRVALETGTHSLWASRALEAAGHSVVVADARRVALIHKNAKKCDAVDARLLARLVRVDVEMLFPVYVRSERTQADLELLRARDVLVGARTSFINHVRGAVKSYGERLAPCGADVFARKALEQLPEALREALLPVVEQIGSLTAGIKEFDAKIDAVSEERYPAVAVLRSVPGVGPITALAYVLTVESPERFGSGRQVGAYFGLVPRRDQSGERDPQLGITKAGDEFVRRLLVSAAHYILGPFGPDTALRRWGLSKASGGKRAKRVAVVAVARKLAVLLHSMWSNGTLYEPDGLPKAAPEATTEATAVA